MKWLSKKSVCVLQMDLLHSRAISSSWLAGKLADSWEAIK